MHHLDIHIRSVQSSDQDAVRGLILAGLKDHFGCIDYARNPDLDDVMERYTRAGHVFVVAEEGQEIVGTGALKIGNGVGDMVRVSVARQHRRKGIGRALVMHLLDVASQLRLKEVAIVTNNDWADAIGLYKGCGFTEYARNRADVFLRRQVDGATRAGQRSYKDLTGP
jgi:ribosomal protein S18 acetylase RimI-like enzyme